MDKIDSFQLKLEKLNFLKNNNESIKNGITLFLRVIF